MKNIGKLAVLGAVLAASSSFAFADTITLGSFGQVGTSGLTNPTVSNLQMTLASTLTCTTSPTCTPTTAATPGTEAWDLQPGVPVWAAPLANSQWVGATSTAGPVGTVNPAYGTYTFTSTITISNGETYSGTLSAMADDTTEVELTNSSGTSEILTPGSLAPDGHCAGGTPNCLMSGTTGTFSLAQGLNTLTFIVTQAGVGPVGGGGDPTGVDFDATLTGVPITTTTPEPSSLMLLGTGLVSAAGMMFRRRRLTA